MLGDGTIYWVICELTLGCGGFLEKLDDDCRSSGAGQ